MPMHHPYTHLLQKRRVSEPEKLARKEKLRTTTLHLKPDAMPNKHRPVRRRSTISSPFNHLRSRTWAPQPEELTRHQPAAPHRSGAKAWSNSYKYPRKGAPHPVLPPRPRNANEAPHPRRARTTIPLRTVATGATMKPGHPLGNYADPLWRQRKRSAT